MEFYRKKKLYVNKNSGASVSFMIATDKTGNVEIKVTAQSSKNQDMITKNLLVVVRKIILLQINLFWKTLFS